MSTTTYEFKVYVQAECPEHACLVMAARTGHDEEVEDARTGEQFDYTITWAVGGSETMATELRDACGIFYRNESEDT